MLCVDGKPLFESAVIAEYLDEISPGSLHPADTFDKAHNRSWIEFASATLNSIAAFYRAPDPQSFADTGKTLRQRFETLEQVLGDGPWFNGQDFSIVDAAFGPVFRYFEVIDEVVDPGFTQGLPRVSAWRTALAARPTVQNAVVHDYHQRLRDFIVELGSELGRRIEARAAA